MESVAGPRLGVFKVINWSKFGFFKTLFVKNTIKEGLQHILKSKRNCARKFSKSVIGPSWPFFGTPNLDPLITLSWTS